LLRKRSARRAGRGLKSEDSGVIDPRARPGALPWLAFRLVAMVAAGVLVVLLLRHVARIPEVRPGQLALGLGQMESSASSSRR
jgi:hypothetical protein